jgi:hypothetical protein
MKKSMIAVLAAMLVLAFSAAAFAGTIQIVNATGFTLQEIYVSDSGTEDWEEDVLGGDVLEDGVTLNLQVNGSYEYFDLAAVDGEDNQASWTGLPGNARKITIYADATADVQ